jgi:nitrate reductase gamma subunit
MEWYHWMASIALGLCCIGLAGHFIKIVKLGQPKDYAPRSGDPSKAIRYSFTGAMSPIKKESAYLHLPTYTAGLVYHMGTFLSLALFVIALLQFKITGIFQIIIPIGLIITGLCGFAILLKRVFSKNLKSLSNPDDFIANILVSAFHFITAYMIYFESWYTLYFILASLLLSYIPISKLKHTLFFFAARYHLGYFYGWRNVWPPKKASN